MLCRMEGLQVLGFVAEKVSGLTRVLPARNSHRVLLSSEVLPLLRGTVRHCCQLLEEGETHTPQALRSTAFQQVVIALFLKAPHGKVFVQISIKLEKKIWTHLFAITHMDSENAINFSLN